MSTLVLAHKLWTGTQFSYDVMGNVIQTKQCFPGRCGNKDFDVIRGCRYDLAGDPIKDAYLLHASYGVEVDTNYVYSSAGEILSISNTLAGAINDSRMVLSNIQNGPAGPLNYQFGNGLGGVSTYDSIGRAAGKWVCNGSNQAGCGGGTQLYGFIESINGD